ncbi:type I-C CRISPR-associated protein Cas5c [soil metagenome]
MKTTSPTLRLRCSGPLAIFTRPELKTERFSYPVPTPSAMRGVFDAIIWKPAIAWHIERIHVLNPVAFSSFRRNEVNNKAVAPKAAVLASGGEAPQFYADEDRAQRNTVALVKVDYLVEARFSLTPRAAEGDNVTKFVEMFERRLEKGQCFHQPYFGCRECVADVRPPDGTEKAIAESDDYGVMLWDIQFGSNGARPENRAVFYWAQMKEGVIDVPPDAEAARASLLAYTQRKGGR